MNWTRRKKSYVAKPLALDLSIRKAYEGVSKRRDDG